MREKLKLTKMGVFLLLLAFSLNALAQNITVRGNITDTSREPLIGVAVRVAGTTTGVVTDFDGDYVLNNVPSNATLEISYVGMVTQTVAVNGRTTINVVMQDDSELLDEVVVVGYGTMQRRQVTSAITSVNAESLPIGVGGSSIVTALRGKIAGLVMSGTDDPNSGNTIQLRGMASINTSRAPLIVIDGMPGGDIRSVTSEEIQSIDVLKDASSGAIYGTRAAGGVILITTKRGTSGRVRMTYTGEVFFKKAFGAPNLLNAEDYIATYQGAKNDYGHSTDWWAEGLNPNPTSNRHVITLQGGSETARIFSSFTYDDNRGVWNGTSRKDFSGRMNADFKALDGWLDITARANYRQAARNATPAMIEGIMRANPTQAVRDPNSQTGWNIWTDGDNTEMNEIGEAALRIYEGLDKWFRPDVSLRLNIKSVPGLSYQQTIGYENRQWELNFYRSMFSREEIRAGRKGYARMDFAKTELLNTDGVFSYVNDFGLHTVNTVAGYSYFERNNQDFYAANYDFTNDRVGFWNLGEGSFLTEGRAGMGSNKGITQKLLGFFARGSYMYDEKYVATASVRREGSSKFALQNQWGTFWSLSGGWRMSREHFLENVYWLDDLMIRLSYGVTGNEGFNADYATRLYSSDTRWLLPTGNWAPSYGVSRNINDYLGWEETREWNLGVDFSVLNDRLYGKVDLFRRKVHGLIYNVEVPQPPNTESTMFKNIGTMSNFGFEVEMGANIVNTRNWNYNTSLNLGHIQTKVGSLWGDQTFMNGFSINNWVEYAHRLEEGTKVGSYFLYRHAGVSDDGRFLIYNQHDEVIYADDGRRDDRVYQGNYMPTLMLGWTHDVRYKNWSLNAMFTSWINFDIYNAIEIQYGLRNVAQGNMTYDAIRKNAHITGRPAPSNYFLYDGTFLKLQNLTLGYTLPMRRHTNDMMENIKLYVTGHNMLTLTNYPGLNPEVNITGWEGGVERAATIYPQARTITLGIQMSF
jgi:TonB-linked SusC/RagA family outer membrane protein